MPAGKTKEEYNAYMRKYMLDRYHRRISEAIIELGAACAHCGSEEISELEFDHIDPSTKSFTIGTKAGSVSEDKLQAELKKCQLLCKTCHDIKTTGGAGRKMARLRCPGCSQVFVKEYRKTPYGRSEDGVACCSRRCAGRYGASRRGKSDEPTPRNLLEVFYE